MKFGELVIFVVGVTVFFIAFGVFQIKRPKKLKVDRFIASWRELQSFCRDKANWPTAIIQADALLDAALKKRKIKGKTMGERLVSAQRLLSVNDEIWFAHNLAKKIISQPQTSLKESEVKDALLGFRQALRDLGALPANAKEVVDDK